MTKQIDSQELDRYLTSWSGCDGGNPNGVWICGIEYGGDFAELEQEFEHFRNHGGYTQTPTGWDDEFRSKNKGFTKWGYHQRVAKLMLALEAEGEPEAPELHAVHEYMRSRLYVRDDPAGAFKLNLYPFSSPSVNSEKWKDAHVANPLLACKDSYYQRCEGSRFRFLAKQRRQFNPRLIIGTGVTFRNQFAKAFGFEEQSKPFDVISGDLVRHCYLYESEVSSLLVTPFFGGRYGFNSNALLRSLAVEIRRRGLYPEATGLQARADEAYVIPEPQ